MTWSFALQDGDLALNNNGLSIVTGESKLLQDLTAYLLTPLGSNDAHPDFGSLLKGGQDNGTIYQAIYNEISDPTVQNQIISEIQRVIAAYQAMQLTRAKADQVAYGKTTLSKGEVLLSVDSIDGSVQDVTVNVSVGLITANGTNPNLDIPLTS
jgi:phage baseplate assembly protein W